MSVKEIVDKTKNKPFFQKMQLSKKEEVTVPIENLEYIDETEKTVSTVNTEKQNKPTNTKKIKAKVDKVKYTFYIPQETLDQFNIILGKKMIRGEKLDRGDVLAQIIEEYYKKDL